MWGRVDDKWHNHPKTAATSWASRGVLQTIWSYMSSHRTDAYITEPSLATIGSPPQDLLDELVDRNWLHRRGQRCRCLKGRKWPADAAYAAHDYLVYHPTNGDGDGTAAGLGDSMTSEGVGSADGDADGPAARALGDGEAACFVGPESAATTPRPPQQRTRNPATDARTMSRTLLDFFGGAGTALGWDMVPRWCDRLGKRLTLAGTRARFKIVREVDDCGPEQAWRGH